MPRFFWAPPPEIGVRMEDGGRNVLLIPDGQIAPKREVDLEKEQGAGSEKGRARDESNPPG